MFVYKMASSRLDKYIEAGGMRARCWSRARRRLPLLCIILINTVAFWVIWRLPASGVDSDADQHEWDTVVWENDKASYTWSEEHVAPDLEQQRADPVFDIDRIPVPVEVKKTFLENKRDDNIADKIPAGAEELWLDKTKSPRGDDPDLLLEDGDDRERAYYESFDLDDVKVLNPPRIHLCRQPALVQILVCSAVQRADLRQAIRNTWGNPETLRASQLQLLFVLGHPVEEFAALEGPLAEEHKLYGDVIQLDLPDTPHHLTQKTLAALAFVRDNCARPVFILKTDDDVFLNPTALATELLDLAGKPSVMFGHVIEGAQPSSDRADKWYMPAHLLETRTFPTYLSGSAYALSSDLVEIMLEELSKDDAHVFWLEDVFVTGMLAPEVGGRLVHTQKILYRKSKGFKACDLHEVISVHGLGAHDLSRYWTLFHNPSNDCILGNSRIHLKGEVIQ